jgi:hypothetical protein
MTSFAMTRAPLVLTVVLLLVMRPSAEAQRANTPAPTLFTPVNEVSFAISPERSYPVGQPITVKYEIVNVSREPLYVPRRWAWCPPGPHVVAWLEDSTHHIGIGDSAIDCEMTLQATVAQRMGKAAVLVKPGERLSETVIVQTKGFLPGECEVEADLSGWNASEFSQADQVELAKMGAPLLEGKVHASAKVTLTPQHEGYAAQWHEFTPANDVSFTIAPEQTSYHVGDPITLKYDLVNVSNRALFAPKPWAVCPPQKHVLAWLEDSAGRHVFGGFGYSCPTNFPTIPERMGKEAQLLKPGDRLSNTVSVEMRTVAVDTKLLAPGNYRVEATFYGWKPEDFSDADLAELAKMDAPFLRGEVPASARITLTR